MANDAKPISGFIKDPISGKPLAGVRVQISNGRDVNLFTSTDQLGYFSGRVPLGGYDVRYLDPFKRVTVSSHRGIKEGTHLGEITGVPTLSPSGGAGGGGGGGKKKEEKEEITEEEKKEEKPSRFRKIELEKLEEKRPEVARPEERARPQTSYGRIQQQLREIRQSATRFAQRTRQEMVQRTGLRRVTQRATQYARPAGRYLARVPGRAAFSAIRGTGIAAARTIGAGARTALTAARIGATLARLGAVVAGAISPEVWVAIGIAALFVFMAFFIVAFTPRGERKVTPQSERLSTIERFTVLPGGDIATCTYYGKSGARKVGNPQLADMVKSITTKVERVPPVVVLGIQRIEWERTFTSTDPNYLANDYEAITSSAGAIGAMQFMPDTFRGTFYRNQAELANKFTKTSYDNTIQPQQIPPPNDSVLRITSIRDSLIAGAFHVRSIKEAKFGSTAAWNTDMVKQVASVYHSGRDYPIGCPYPGGGSYCDDLARTFQECNPTMVARLPETAFCEEGPNPPNKLELLQNKFNITVTGFSDEQLKRIWEKMCEVSNTKWPELVSGAEIKANYDPSGVLSYVGFGACPRSNQVCLYPYADPAIFKFILVHELTHVAYFTKDRALTKRNEHESLDRIEGAVSWYGQYANMCSWDNAPSEDYAEMMAYYLNPRAGLSSAPGCANGGGPKKPNNPFFHGIATKYPLHYNLAKEILQK